MEHSKTVAEQIREMYAGNWFMNQFGISIDLIEWEHVIVSLQLKKEKHFNHRSVCHGGVLSALADSVTGVTGASAGAAVATLNMNMNFIKSVKKECRLFVESRVMHRGHTTMLISAEMYDEEGTRYATMTASMFILKQFEFVPEQWK